jgi:hypothetical protein
MNPLEPVALVFRPPGSLSRGKKTAVEKPKRKPFGSLITMKPPNLLSENLILLHIDALMAYYVNSI